MNLKQFSKDLLLIIAGLVLAVGGYQAWQTHVYHDTSNPQQVLKTAAKTDQQTVLIFHKTGCPDCKSVVTTVNKGIKDNQSDTKFVVVDTKDSDLYQKYNVTEVPTVIALQHGQEERRVVGTDKQQLSRILAGE